MARVVFTPNIQRHVECPPMDAAGHTVQEVLEAVFENNAKVRNYILDDRGAVRQHIAIFVNGKTITDRSSLTDTVAPTDEVYVMQALSGGSSSAIATSMGTLEERR